MICIFKNKSPSELQKKMEAQVIVCPVPCGKLIPEPWRLLVVLQAGVRALWLAGVRAGAKAMSCRVKFGEQLLVAGKFEVQVS